MRGVDAECCGNKKHLMKYIIIITAIFLSSIGVNGQSFQGELMINNIYFVKGTSEQLFPPIVQKEFYNDRFKKVQIPDAADGQLDWQIEDYENNLGFLKKSDKRKDTSYFVTDKPMTYEKDGKTYFKMPQDADKSKVVKTKVIEYNLCEETENEDKYVKSDMTVMIAGIKSKLIMHFKNDELIGEYYYTDSIKLDPKFYACNSQSSSFYKFTDGAMITKFINYDFPMYDYIYEIQSIDYKQLENSFFDLPKNE